MSFASTGVMLAIVAAFGWAGLDVLRKRLAARLSTVVLLWGLVATQTPMFAVGLAAAPAEFDGAAYWRPGLATLVLNLTANVAFIRALEVGALSRTIPLLSLTPAITVFTGAGLLGEWPQSIQLLGIGLVVTGTVILAVGRSEGRPRLEPGTLLMLVVAAAWSVSAAVDKVALSAVPVAAHGLVQSVGFCIAVTVYLGARRRLGSLATLRPVAREMLLAAVVTATAASLQYLAIERILVSTVETIKRAVGAGVALTVGGLVLNEQIRRRDIFAAALIIAGTTCVLQPGPQANSSAARSEAATAVPIRPPCRGRIQNRTRYPTEILKIKGVLAIPICAASCRSVCPVVGLS